LTSSDQSEEPVRQHVFIKATSLWLDTYYK